MFNHLDFRPFPGLASPHLQMILANFGPTGQEPPSKSILIPLGEGDYLSCEFSTPSTWKPHQPTIAMVHGLGGNHQSSYLIRLSRKFYTLGIRSVRINLRGAGSGEGLSKLPYNCGNSEDIFAVLKEIKDKTPLSPIYLIGFSLGGNISLKLVGELKEKASLFLERVVAVCPVVDLAKTLVQVTKKSNWLYHKYYLNKIIEQSQKWIKDLNIRSIYEFDEKVTVPIWGFKDPSDYYNQCSSGKTLQDITIACDLLFAKDDPFIDYKLIKEIKTSSTTKVWLTHFGGHMGFIGPTESKESFYWMDKLLIDWHIAYLKN